MLPVKRDISTPLLIENKTFEIEATGKITSTVVTTNAITNAQTTTTSTTVVKTFDQKISSSLELEASGDDNDVFEEETDILTDDEVLRAPCNCDSSVQKILEDQDSNLMQALVKQIKAQVYQELKKEVFTSIENRLTQCEQKVNNFSNFSRRLRFLVIVVVEVVH